MKQFKKYLAKYLATILGCAILSLASQAVNAQGCSRDAIQKYATDVRSSRQRLLATKIADDPDTSVSPGPQKEIHRLKDALSAAISAYLRCEEGDSVDLKAMETNLLGMMAVDEPKSTQPSEANQNDDSGYGKDLQIVISHPATEPKLIAVTMSFGMECGSDSLLLIYERKANAWQESLRWQSGDYSKISGAFGDLFEYVVLPQDPGQWVVAVVHGTPWCTSVWSAFALDLIQPKRDVSPQQVLQHMKYGYVIEDEPVIKYRPGGFEFRVEKGIWDFGILRRQGIYRFRLVNNRLERVQPIAMNGRDFVDEWLQVSWSDAQRWSDPANLNSLQQEHTRINALRNSAKMPEFTYGPVHPCSDDPKHFQVELDLSPGPASYFHIRQGNNSFVMLSAAAQPDPACKGPNLMPKQ
jgi:hypothetical protein